MTEKERKLIAYLSECVEALDIADSDSRFPYVSCGDLKEIISDIIRILASDPEK